MINFLLQQSQTNSEHNHRPWALLRPALLFINYAPTFPQTLGTPWEWGACQAQDTQSETTLMVCKPTDLILNNNCNTCSPRSVPHPQKSFECLTKHGNITEPSFERQIQQHSRSSILISVTQCTCSIQAIFTTAGMFSDSLILVTWLYWTTSTARSTVFLLLGNSLMKQTTQIRWIFLVMLLALLFSNGLGVYHTGISSHTKDRHLSCNFFCDENWFSEASV